MMYSSTFDFIGSTELHTDTKGKETRRTITQKKEGTQNTSKGKTLEPKTLDNTTTDTTTDKTNDKTLNNEIPVKPQPRKRKEYNTKKKREQALLQAQQLEAAKRLGENGAITGNEIVYITNNINTTNNVNTTSNEQRKKRTYKPRKKKSESDISKGMDERDKDVKEKKKKKKDKEAESTNLYTWTFDYDNNDLLPVRLPTKYSVPEHLIKEFELLFPRNEEEKKKGKFMLDPSQPLEGRAKEYMEWMQKIWTPSMLSVMVCTLLSEKITLSLIDWMCINYAKVIPVIYANSKEDHFNLYDSYKQNLDTFYRPYFDVFSRNQRVLVEFMDDDCPVEPSTSNTVEIEWDTKKQVGVRYVSGHKMIYIITSVGQLNFFRWAVMWDVIDYCEEHAEQIRKHMNEGKQKPAPGNGKRRKLSESPSRSWYIKDTKIHTINYDFLDEPCVNDSGNLEKQDTDTDNINDDIQDIEYQEVGNENTQECIENDNSQEFNDEYESPNNKEWFPSTVNTDQLKLF